MAMLKLVRTETEESRECILQRCIAFVTNERE